MSSTSFTFKIQICDIYLTINVPYISHIILTFMSHIVFFFVRALLLLVHMEHWLYQNSLAYLHCVVSGYPVEGKTECRSYSDFTTSTVWNIQVHFVCWYLHLVIDLCHCSLHGQLFSLEKWWHLRTIGKCVWTLMWGRFESSILGSMETDQS